MPNDHSQARPRPSTEELLSHFETDSEMTNLGSRKCYPEIDHVGTLYTDDIENLEPSSTRATLATREEPLLPIEYKVYKRRLAELLAITYKSFSC